MDTRMILLDLDGTLLDSQKRISPENYAALEHAAQSGLLIVPCTGRFYDAMPDSIRNLPFVRYVITINGAELYDTTTQTALHRSDIPLEEGLSLFRYMDTLPVIYDCFQSGWGWMDSLLYQKIDQFIFDPHINEMVKQKRTPVVSFQETLRQRNLPIQKSQMFLADLDLRQTLLDTLPQQLPHLSVTTSLPMNIEFNSRDAHKGHALEVLCRLLNLSPSQAMAFGDGNNDLSMITTAGIGVAMGNAIDEVKSAANYVTDTNDHHGVAAALTHFGLI